MNYVVCAAVVSAGFLLAGAGGAVRQPGAAAPPVKPAPTAQPTSPATAKPTTSKSKDFEPLLLKVREALDQAGSGGDMGAATATIATLWDWTCVNVPLDRPEVFMEVGAAQRLLTYVQQLKGDVGDRAATVKLLRASPRLCDALVYQVASQGEDPGSVLTVLKKLAAKYPAKQLEEMASLTAAICVVYDKPVVKIVNENVGKGVAPEEAFQYYTNLEGRMVFSPRSMPTELLIFMVDPGASLDELSWAMDKYGGQREVGPRYTEIHYDNDHFKRGKEKKIDTEGFNLPNIKKYGGICADQAHFASTVGKAIGVPAVVDSGQGEGVGHAWLGYLKVQGKGAEWNFDTGRYDEYENIRGSVVDPQTGTEISDGALALSAEAMSVSEQARWASTALADAAVRLAKITAAPSPSGLELPTPAAPRTAKADDRLAMLRASLTLYPANHRAWNVVKTMASAKELSVQQKTEWAEALQSMCGNKYPDFTLAVLTPMVASIDDVTTQGGVWDSLYKRLRGNRPDLAAQVLIQQGKMWDKAGKPEKAYESYTAAAYQFITKSPASVDALELCEAMLKARNVAGEALTIWANAWRRLSKPGNMAQEFLTQSNWYKVGSHYARLLETDGQDKKAEQVWRALGEDDRAVERRERQRERQKR